ncbi:uncharacterized protein [Clytia hemisphaerica]
MAGKQIRREHGTAAMIMGLIEILCGAIVVVLSFVVGGKGDLSATLKPYWAGIVFVVPGFVGLIVGLTKNHCSMIGFMVLNILAFVIQAIAMVLLGLVILIYTAVAKNVTKYCRPQNGGCKCNYDDGTHFFVGAMKDCEVLADVTTILTVILASLGVAALVALSASILGCVSICCTAPTTTAVIMKDGTDVPLQQHQQPPAYNESEYQEK